MNPRGEIRLDDRRVSNLEERIRTELGKLLAKHQEAPLGGLVGVPLVNVLELNIEVKSAMEQISKEIQ